MVIVVAVVVVVVVMVIVVAVVVVVVVVDVVINNLINETLYIFRLMVILSLLLLYTFTCHITNRCNLLK